MKNDRDWHRADIIAALKKKGLSVSALSTDAGLKRTTLHNTFRTPWPKGEAIIAHALDLQPCDIWPSRYSSERKAS